MQGRAPHHTNVCKISRLSVLEQYLRSVWTCSITFKLAKFANGKALFSAVSMDIYLLVVKS